MKELILEIIIVTIIISFLAVVGLRQISRHAKEESKQVEEKEFIPPNIFEYPKAK